MMTSYYESGLKISLPSDEHFRFQDCKAYKPLSGQNLKEMDFGWWQAEKNTLCLIEIKDYTHLTPTERLPAHLLNTFINKATDSLLMLATMWAKIGKGFELSSCLPLPVQQFPSHSPEKLRLKLFFILKIDKVIFRSQLGILKDELNDRLRGRVALFNVRHVSLLDHLTVINNNLLPIQEN